MDHARFTLLVFALAGALFAAILLFLELGRRIGLLQTAKHGPSAQSGIGMVTTVVSWLLTLLLGFSFSGATSRFDARRDLVSKEVNAIGTAWQRIDALPPAPRPAIRADFLHYFDAVLGSYSSTSVPRLSDALRQDTATVAAQNNVWSKSVAACLAPDGEKARMLLLPSLNEMFDAIDAERLARRMHPPLVIWVMLVVAILAASLLAGHGMATAATRHWLYMIAIAATISMVVFVIVELEFPRLGSVRVSGTDSALYELRATMQ